MNKFIYFFAGAVFAIMLGLATAADAGGNGGNTYNYYYDQDGSDNGNSGGDRDYDRGIAIAMALGNSQFDYASGWQGSGTFSWYEDEEAFGFHTARRIDDILVNGGLACDIDFEVCGGVVTANWHF